MADDIATAKAPRRGSEEEYEKDFTRLVIHAAKRYAVGEDDILSDPELLVKFFKERIAEFRPNTFYKYRAALVWGLEGEGTRHAAAAIAALKAMRAPKIDNLKPATRRRPLKALPPGEARRFAQKLRSGTGAFTILAAPWFYCTLWTGLRPVEWCTARIERAEDGAPHLVLVNAKQNEVRTTGPTRRLDLSRLSDQQLEMIEHFSTAIRIAYEDAGIRAYQKLYKECRKLFIRASEKVWPEEMISVSIMTARHEFKRRAELVMDRPELAALMGHASTRSQSRYGGRGSRSKRRPGPDAASTALPLPDPAETERVRDDHSARYRALQKAKSYGRSENPRRSGPSGGGDRL